MCPIIYYISCSDWEVFYGPDGIMLSEGHSVPWEIIFKIGQSNPNAKIKSMYLSDDEVEKIDWNFPQNFYDLPDKYIAKATFIN